MTVLYPSPIFGPIHSRRLGISLGINLLPSDGKCCSFDCLYCECGLNAAHTPKTGFPSRECVADKLEEKLQQMIAENCIPNVLTFAGNGEPTLHPQFPEIIADTIALRNRYVPSAAISVLSNATQIVKPRVFEALKQVDNNIQKLDTVNADYIQLLDRPHGNYHLETIIDRLVDFEGHVIIQTMFLEGTDAEGNSVSNTSAAFVEPWLSILQRIKPQQVMVYTVDRETPITTLCKATPATLDAIAHRVETLGIPCSVAY